MGAAEQKKTWPIDRCYMHINRYQSGILNILFSNMNISDDIDSLEFSLSGNFDGKYLCAYSNLSEGLDYVAFNIPNYSNSVFLGLSRNNPQDVALTLANLEDYEREKKIKLGLGEVVVMPNNHTEGRNIPFGVILLRTATSIDCAGVPDYSIVEGNRTSFFLAAPLTEEEHQIRALQGHDALMDSFEANQKDIFF